MMKPRTILPLLSGFLLLVFSGCATRYPVHIDALSAEPARSGASGSTYVLESDTPGIETTDLFFKEVARQVNTALGKAGYRESESREGAGLVISVNAHLSDPMTETREYSEPVYYNSPGRLRTVRIPILGPDGKVVRYAHRSYWSGPRTHLAGYVDRDRQVTVYDKILKLSAREAHPPGKAGDEVWALSVRLRSGSTDYRSALPYLLLAAEPYIGQRTEGEIVVDVLEDAEGLDAYRSPVPDGG